MESSSVLRRHYRKYPKGGEQPVVLLCLQNRADSQLIREYLSNEYTIMTSPGGECGIIDTDFDLCILDRPTFAQNRERLLEYKESMAPVIVPLLLFVRSDLWTRTFDPIWSEVDDVIPIPIHRHILLSRIKSLLRSRRYSLELKQKNEQLSIYEQAIHATNTGVLITDARKDDNPIIFANKGFEELTGYEQGEILGRNCRFLQGEDRGQKARTDLRSFIDTGQEGHSLIRNYRKDGTPFWNELNIAPIRNKYGEITHFVGIQNDVTELVEARAKLQEEKEFMGTVMNLLPNMFFMVDAGLNFTMWNAAFEQILGYGEEEIREMSPVEFFPDRERGMVQAKIKEIYERGEAEMEADAITKEGSIKRLYAIGKRFDRDGETYIIGSAIDITERAQAKYELEQQKQLMSAIINQSDSVIYVKDSDGLIILANQKFQQLFEADYNEVVNLKDEDFVSKDEIKEIRQNDLRVLETDRSMEFEETVTFGEDKRHFLSIKYPLKNVPGFEGCLCGISTDITEQKRTMHQLEERMKEQKCLYRISSMVEEDYPVGELLERAVGVIVEGFQYPDITEAAIIYNEKTYATDGFRETEWMLKANGIQIEGHSLTLKVVYLQEKPELDEGPFMKEERELINAVADSIAYQIERIIALDKLKESENRWKTLVANDPDLVMILDEMEVRFINEAGALMYGTDNPEELIGRNMFDLVEIKDTEYARSRLQQVMEGEAVESVVHTVTAPDGRIRMLEVQSLPVTYQGKSAIQIVGRDITERVQYEKELQNSLEEKEVLLQEIHHRVKNNLAIISSMLQIQQLNSNDEKLNSILANSELRVKSIALIHEKLYQSESFSDIGFRSYIEDLVKAIQATNKTEKDISVLLECEDISLNVNQALPCALILNELITNAMIHAFTDRKKGLIRVVLREEDDCIFARIEDNGKGLPEDFEQRSRSMGYTIIKTLIAQLQAEFSLSNRLDGGTHAEFSFRKSNIKGSTSTLV